MKRTFLLLTVFVFFLVMTAPNAQSHQKVTSLPKSVKQLSPFIPGMGAHWGDPANLPVGPIYIVHDGEVIGMEYKFTKELMKEITVDTPEGKMAFRELSNLPIGSKVDHINISFLPNGHEKFEVPYFDVHLYFISYEKSKETLVPHKH